MITTTCRILWIPAGGGWCMPSTAATAARSRRGMAPATLAAREVNAGKATSAQRRDVDLALTRTVELAEEDPLPRAERELAVAQRHEHLRRDQRRAHVRGRVRPVRILDVL